MSTADVQYPQKALTSTSLGVDILPLFELITQVSYDEMMNLIDVL